MLSVPLSSAMSTLVLPTAPPRAAVAPTSASAASPDVSTADVSDDAERAVLWLKVSDVRSVVSRQQRSIARLRSKLSRVAERKSPLIDSLQLELARQQADISSLRSELASQHSTFALDEESAHDVYDAALRSIEANSRLALSDAQTEVDALLEAGNELASFALVESALQSKCSQLSLKNDDNESKHRRRMADMRRQWDDSRVQLQQAASSARHESSRRYKQQVMAAINISYSRISDEIATMQHNKQSEARQLRRLDDQIQQCRQTIGAEKERERDEQRQRADSQRSLLDVRLQLRQVTRDIVHEQHKLGAHRLEEGQRRQQLSAARLERHEQLESELRAWQAVRAAYERSVRRVRRVVSEVDRARHVNSFQQLVDECVEDVRSATQPRHTLPVATVSDEERQRMLRLLFVRVRQAESECLQRQQHQSSPALPDASPLGTALVDATREVDLTVPETAVAHSGSSFFLTQNPVDETKKLINNGSS